MSSRRWSGLAVAVAVCCAILTVVLLRAPRSVTVPLDDWAELVAALLAAAACGFAGFRGRGRTRVAWCLVGASAACWGAGQGVWTYFELGIHDNPFPSLADAGFVAAVPVLLAGLFTMPVWPAGASAKARAVSDGLLIAGGLILVSWNTVLAALVAAPAYTALAQGLSLTYPICDVIVVTVLAIMWSRASTGTRGPILVILAGLALLAVSDSTFAYLQAQSSFGSGGVIDMGWVAGYLVVGLGALLSLNRPLQATNAAVPRWRTVALPYLPVPLVVGFAVQERVVAGAISVFTLSLALAVFLIVLLRQAFAVQENMSLLRRLARNETELHHRAEHDPLTDLLNRSSFIRFVEERLSEPAGTRLYAVMFVDLDDFKQINDSLGHSSGDDAIVAVGRRLQSCMRDGDLVGRLGGDEFAVFLTNLHNIAELVGIAERLIEALNEPFQSADRQASVSGTIGVAIAETGDEVGELLRRADIAMYAAKARGKGRFGIFEPSMHVAMHAPLQRRAELERAITDGELSLTFQPVVEVVTRRIAGVEALLRWEHPRLGPIGPATFLDDIEKGGMMIEAGRWVVLEAAREVVRLREATGADLFASVNVSSSQVHHHGFVAMVGDALAESGLPASALVIELTESGSLGESEVVAARLQALRAWGVRIAIDDFGSGYASFTYLRTLHVDILKIDRSFTGDLLGGGAGAALVEGMVRLATSLHLLTVGAGVEDEAQHGVLIALGCDMAQGHLYARPMPMDELILLHAQSSSAVEAAAGV